MFSKMSMAISTAAFQAVLKYFFATGEGIRAVIREFSQDALQVKRPLDDRRTAPSSWCVRGAKAATAKSHATPPAPSLSICLRSSGKKRW